VQEAFGIVLFVVVGVSVVVAIVLLLGSGRLYDDIGHGGMSIGEDRDPRPPAPAGSDPEVLEEVRALVAARNARRIAHGREPLDVEAEMARELRNLPG
jgi:hypothetical protein